MVRKLEGIGTMSWAVFDAICRRIVTEMAVVVRTEIASGKLRTRSKANYAGVADEDIVTTADVKAQRQFVVMAERELPPGVGWIGEEGGLQKRPKKIGGHTFIVTVDPVDGTRNLNAAVQAKRRLVPGEVSAMIGLLVDGVPVASYICDIATLVIYTTPPYGPRTLRIRPGGKDIETRHIDPRTRRLSGRLLVHGRREVTNLLTRRLIGEVFGSSTRERGSIGLAAARVMAGEFVGMVRIAGGYFTPWDDTPVLAMCEQGGLVALQIQKDELVPLPLPDLRKVVPSEYDILYVEHRQVDRLARHAPIMPLLPKGWSPIRPFAF